MVNSSVSESLIFCGIWYIFLNKGYDQLIFNEYLLQLYSNLFLSPWTMSYWTRAEFLGASVKRHVLSHRSREVKLWLWQTFQTNHVFSRTVLNLWYTFGDICHLLCTFWQLEICVNISVPLDNTHHTLSVWSRSHNGLTHHSLQQAESTWQKKDGHDKPPSTPCPLSAEPKLWKSLCSRLIMLNFRFRAIYVIPMHSMLLHNKNYVS